MWHQKYHSLQRLNTENSKQIPRKELCGLSLNFHIYVSLSDYIFPGSVGLFCYRKICGPILGKYKLLTYERTHAIPFLGIHIWDFHCSAGQSDPLQSGSKLKTILSVLIMAISVCYQYSPGYLCPSLFWSQLLLSDIFLVLSIPVCSLSGPVCSYMLSFWSWLLLPVTFLVLAAPICYLSGPSYSCLFPFWFWLLLPDTFLAQLLLLPITFLVPAAPTCYFSDLSNAFLVLHISPGPFLSYSCSRLSPVLSMLFLPISCRASLFPHVTSFGLGFQSCPYRSLQSTVLSLFFFYILSLPIYPLIYFVMSGYRSL